MYISIIAYKIIYPLNSQIWKLIIYLWALNLHNKRLVDYVQKTKYSFCVSKNAKLNQDLCHLYLEFAKLWRDLWQTIEEKINAFWNNEMENKYKTMEKAVIIRNNSTVTFNGKKLKYFLKCNSITGWFLPRSSGMFRCVFCK